MCCQERQTGMCYKKKHSKERQDRCIIKKKEKKARNGRDGFVIKKNGYSHEQQRWICSVDVEKTCSQKWQR